MRLDSIFYRLAYRRGKPRWDSTEPRPDLAVLIRGSRPGRALDLGCGTGSDAIFLARQGWDVTGVDFVPRAIETARQRAAGSGVTVDFVVGDVTRLRQFGVGGPFDFVTDIGCYHTIPGSLRDAYANEVAAVARGRADFYLAGVSSAPATWRMLGARGIDYTDLGNHFGKFFDVGGEQKIKKAGRSPEFVLYHLVRKG